MTDAQTSATVNIRAPAGYDDTRWNQLRNDWQRIETPEGPVYVRGWAPIGVATYPQGGGVKPEEKYHCLVDKANDPRRSMIAGWTAGEGRPFRFKTLEAAKATAEAVNKWARGE